MKKADAQTLLTLMDELTELMTEYDRRTDRMVTNDLEVIQQVLLSRNELMDKMRHLHDIKSGIDEKDKKVTAVVRQSYEDVKAELESLKVDKKKIDYYSSVKLGGKGRTFNTNS